MAAISALAHGLAVVGNDIGGLRDVVEDGVNGRLCPPDDPRGLELGLRELLVSKEGLLRMKQASWEKARVFDMERIGDRFEQILEGLAKT
jgi:glycosyltransferase involved in cell wall biosynthesis